MTFDEAGLNADEVLHALVLGGNLLAAQQGATKQRRRVPRKQEQLLRLVAEHGTATFDQLRETFSREWNAIAARREGEYLLVAKRELFRNIADLAGRINAALLATYGHDAEARRLTRGLFLGLVFDHQAFTVTWTTAETLAELEETLHRSSGTGHVPLTRANAGNHTPHHEPADDDTHRDAFHEPSAPPAPAQPRHEPPNTLREVTVFEDPVTGVWRFTLRGHAIEVERAHGFVKIDGNLHTVTAVLGLEQAADLGGRPLEAIERLLATLEAQAAGE